ncbi:MAG: aminotransferase class V-fold PLP-dependent enzyme [Desulfurococcales archaeon]|nr:aminotransferase class V-fold PLP-dependent enzyme [Desulfurococcales archaeon]
MSGEFPAASHYRAYLNTASIGLAWRESIDAMIQASKLYTGNVSKAESAKYSLIDSITKRFSKLYGFNPASIGVGESTTHCIYRLALSRPDTELIGLSFEEFPGIARAVESGCRFKGCRVKVYNEGTVEDSVKAAVDDGAQVVVVSAVTWVTGYRTDLASIISYARKRDTLVVVDAVQHFGALSLREGEETAHAYAASVKKWLLTPHAGLGVCVVSREMTGFDPVFHGLGNLAIEDWDEYWSNPAKGAMPVQSLREDGHRYSAPTGLSVPGLAAFEATLRLFSRIGVADVEGHIMGLKELLLDLLRDYGVETFQDYYPESRHSGIASLRVEPSLARRVVGELARDGIAVSARGQAGLSGIRVSVHVYNGEDDVRLVAEKLRRYIKV